MTFNGWRHYSHVAFLAASLHIVSPAGIFLSAPYGESIFSFLQFGGLHCYILAKMAAEQSHDWKSSFLLLSSGMFFGLATLIRSNGILSGLIFLWDAVVESIEIVQSLTDRTKLRRMVCTLLAGSFVVLGTIVPQYKAYVDYCVDIDLTPPWCSRFPPSIYAFVQAHYW